MLPHVDHHQGNHAERSAILLLRQLQNEESIERFGIVGQNRPAVAVDAQRCRRELGFELFVTAEIAVDTPGELAGGLSPRTDRIAAALIRAGVECESVGDIARARWEKFVFLVGLAATTALTGEPIGVIREDPHMRGFLRAAMDEAAAVGRARGIDFAEDYADQRLAFADSLPQTMTSSMSHDLAAGKPLELDWLCGAVAQMGLESGVPTPVNTTVYAALKTRRGGGQAAS